MLQNLGESTRSELMKKLGDIERLVRAVLGLLDELENNG